MAFVLLIEPDHHCGLSPFPWGILAVGSHLSARNIPVALINASYLDGSSFEAELSRLLPQATLLGVSCFSTDVAWVLDLLARVKALRPELPVILGGPHPTLLPEQTVLHPLVDYVVCGPGEVACADLALLLDVVACPVLDTPKRLAAIPGLFWRDVAGIVRSNPSDGAPPEVSTDYYLLPEGKQRHLLKYMEVLAGRGCSFACAFCYNAVCGHKWVGKPAHVLADELESLVHRFNPPVVYFRDENFFHSKERVLAFIGEYRNRGFRFRWDATCRANYFNKNYINQDLLLKLESINCRRLKFGMESGSPRVLKLLHKGIRVEHILHVAQALAGSGIIGNYSFLMGVPGEMRSDYEDTLGLIRRIIAHDPKAEIIGPQYYRVYPGGELYNEAVAHWNFRQPETFEQWGECVRGDFFGLDKAQNYRWIDGSPDLPRRADFLVLLARKPLLSLLHPLKIPALPFALLARLRLRLGFYAGMWDMRLAAWMFGKYVSAVYLPKSKAGLVG
ncbi:MAG: radical SAM protein [Pseudomonadota bacterium]